MILLSAFVAVLLFLAVAVLAWAQIEVRARRLRAANTRLRAHDQLVDRLRELAWDHRDIDPFAVIVLDEIRTFTNQQPEITQ